MNTTYIVLAVVVSIIIYFDYQKYKRNTRPKVHMVWLYKPGCGHCIRMEKAWKEFEDSSPSYVSISRINIIEEPSIAEYFNVVGVPHIVKVVEGRQYVFNGDRTSENFLEFATME
jgi:thioredoxin-like negative regulator of GroEL